MGQNKIGERPDIMDEDPDINEMFYGKNNEKM